MFKISRLADYGSLILYVLTRQTAHSLSATQLSQKIGVGRSTVCKILKLLHSAQLVYSKQGSQGGYRLARLPNKITLAQIVAAVDGPIAITVCSIGGSQCHLNTTCQLRLCWQFVNSVIYYVLDNWTLSDICVAVEESGKMPIKWQQINQLLCQTTAFSPVLGQKHAVSRGIYNVTK